MSGMHIMFWMAVIMLIDAAVGLYGESLWRKLAPKVPIRRIALIEAVLALAILGVYFFREYGRI